MMIIKNIIKATIATTAVISSAFAMVLPGNALSPVTYKAASNYKLVPMGPTSCVVMSYTCLLYTSNICYATASVLPFIIGNNDMTTMIKVLKEKQKMSKTDI